jgi:hypothetical protein
MSLSDRLRPDVEAAPWVIEEVKRLEVENARLRDALESVLESEVLKHAPFVGYSEAIANAREVLEGK